MKTIIIMPCALLLLLGCAPSKEIRIEPVVITVKSTEIVHREGIEDQLAIHARGSNVQNYYIQVPKSEERNYHVGSNRGYMVVSKGFKLYDTHETQTEPSFLYVLGWEQQGRSWAVNFEGSNGLSYFLDAELRDSSIYIPGAAMPFLVPR